MNLPRWAVGRPVAVAMLVLTSLLAGWLSLSRMNSELLPPLSLPYAVIATLYPGADPSTVEQEVTAVVERAAAAAAGVRNVESFSVENASFVIVEFHWGTDMGRALEGVRAQLGAISFLLPAEARPPVALPVNPSQLPVMLLALQGDDLQGLTDLALDVVQPRLEQLPGVGQATVVGGLQREVEVLYHSDRLREEKLTPAWLHQMISLQQVVVPAGSIEAGGVHYNARVGRPLRSVEELAQLVVGERESPQATFGLGALVPQTVQLQDVADVREVAKPRSGTVRVNGEPAILLRIVAQPGANTVQVSRQVRAALAELQAGHPGLIVRTVHDQADSIQGSLWNLALYGAIGAILAGGVLVLFIREARALLVVASSIPLSVLLTFTGLYAGGLSLNLLTLGGIAIGTGMLLDNAIIVVENMVRLRREGAGPAAAAVQGTGEVFPAMVGSTATTLVVFLPIAFISGLSGILFRQLGVTISIALAASLLVATTVVPALGARVFRGAPSYYMAERRWQAVTARYRGSLQWCLQRPWLAVGGAAALCALALPLVPRIGVEFLPATQSAGIYLQAFAPPGTPEAETDRRIRAFEEALREIPEVRDIVVQVGDPGATDLLAVLQGAQANSGLINLTIDPSRGPGRPTPVLQDVIRQRARQVPGLEVYTIPDRETGPVGDTLADQVIVRVLGPDLETVGQLAAAVEDRLGALGAFPELQVLPRPQAPELVLDVNRQRSLLGGLTLGQVGLAVRHALVGEQVATLQLGGKAVPVVVRPHPAELADLDSLMDFRVSSPIPLPNGDTPPVRLSNISEATVSHGQPGIRRSGGQRMMEVRVTIGGTDPRRAKEIVEKALSDIDVPPGYHIQLRGIHALVEETLGDLVFALLLGLIAVYIVLAAHFESWVHPFIIMASVPLAAVGALPALYLSGERLGATAVLGLIILGGLVVNNGIVLLDYMGRLRAEGKPWQEAILTAAGIRLRPILMTAATTLLGLIPLIVASSPGTEMQRPLAVALGGGLLSSTLLTLFVVPCLYLLLVSRRGGHRGPSPAGAGLKATAILVCLLPAIAAAPAAAAEGSGATPPAPRYALGIGSLLENAGPELQFRLFNASNPASGPGESFRLGLQTDWYRPVSVIGYRRIQGDFLIRRAGDDEAHALSLQSHNVLGNWESRLEVSYVDGIFGATAMPQRVPAQPFLFNGSTGMYQVKGELREGRSAGVVWVRDITWIQPLGNRADVEREPGTFMLTSGSEIRAGSSWIIGKAGVLLSGPDVIPIVRTGARFRAGEGARLEIGVSSATEHSRHPALDLQLQGGGQQPFFTMVRAEYVDDGTVRPSLYFGIEPERGRTQWQLMVRTDRFVLGMSTAF